MKSSQLLVKCLENEGVGHVFGVPGEEIMDVIDALADSAVEFVPTRHEQGAAFMADGVGRLTGKAGVCLSTLGPGALNLATGIADANLDHSPVVAITGQVELASAHKEYHQYLDIVHSFSSITKWNTRVDTPDIISEVVRRAFSIAEDEKPGAVHFELPEDVAEMPAAGSPMPVRPPELQIPGNQSLSKAAELINRAKHPIILAGNGVIRGHASEVLRRLVDLSHIPAANTFMGKGTIPADSDMYVGTIGLQAHDHVACGFDRADLIIAIGYDIVEYTPKRWNPDSDKTIIHVDFTPADVQLHYVPEQQLVGDIASTLNELAPLLDRRPDETYYRELRDFLASERENNDSGGAGKISPQRVVRAMRQVLGRDDILVSDVGAHKLWIARLYPAYEPNTVLISNGLASMGFAVPAAIAAKLVQPQKRVIAACGDGGFLMNVQELETAERLGLSIVYVIFHDSAYGLIKWKQTGKYTREHGVEFGNPDFVRLAEAFGIRGYRVQDPSELDGALAEAFSRNKSAVIDVPVDYEENYRLSRRLGSMICPM